MTGQGDLFVSSYGAIERHDLTAAESMTVDTGHIVTFDTDGGDVHRVGALKSTLFSGEAGG